MASAGSLIFELAADVSRLRTDMQKAQAEMNASLASIAKSSAVTAFKMGADFAAEFARAFSEKIKSAIDAADAMGKMAERVGTTTEALSALAYQASQADASTEDLAAGFRGMSKAIIDAAKPTSDAAAAFKAIGVNVDDLKGKDPAAAMAEIADAMSGFKDGADKVEVARAIFGKTGDTLIPMLNQGAKGFADAKKEAEDLGAVIKDSTAKSADEFNTQLTKLSTVEQSLWSSIAQELLPTVKDLAKYFVDAANDGSTFKEVLNAVAEAGAFAAQVLIGTTANVSAAAKAFSIFNEAYKAPVGDIEAQKQARANMMKGFEDIRTIYDKAADAQERISKSREAARNGKQDPFVSATEAHNADQAAKKTLDYAGALKEAAEAGKHAKKEISDYQRMVEALDDTYRKTAAEGDPMKELLSDPKYLAASKAQQEDLVARTQRNIDLKNAILARAEVEENTANEEARQYEEAVKRWKAEEDHAEEIAKWADQQQRAVDPMIDYNEQVDKLNEALKEGLITSNEEYLAILEKINDEYDKAVDKTDPYMEQLKEIQQAIEGFGKQASDALVEFVFSTKDASVSFSQMVSSILKDIAKMLVYQNVFKPLFASISGGVSGFDWGSLFQGGRMGGGPVSAGKLYEINELPGRAEYFIPNVPGRIVTDASAGNGGSSVVVNVNVAKDDRATQDTTANEKQAAELGNRIAMVVRQVISTEKRTGGLLAPR